MTAGRFFGMDAESRHIFDELHGGEAGRHNRVEQRALNPLAQTVAEAQATRDHHATSIAAREKKLGGAVMTEAQVAAQNVKLFGSEILAAAVAVRVFVAALSSQATTTTGRAPAPGLNTGHALGHRPVGPMGRFSDSPGF